MAEDTATTPSEPEAARRRSEHRIATDLVRRGFYGNLMAHRMAHVVVAHGIEESDLLLKDPEVWWDMHRLLHKTIPGQEHSHNWRKRDDLGCCSER